MSFMSRLTVPAVVWAGALATGVGLFASIDRGAQAHVQAPTRDLRAAEAGDAEAQFRVGWTYLTAGSNLPLAAQWFAKAAAQGLAAAQYQLASMHASGAGVPEDGTKAAELFRRAAEHGHREAMVGLGALLLQGRGPDIAVPGFQSTDVERLRAAAGHAVTVTGTVARVERMPRSPEPGEYYNLYIYFTGGDAVRIRAVPAYADKVDATFGRDGLIGKKVSVTVPRLYATNSGPIEIGITRVDQIRVEGSPDRPEADRRRARATASRPEALQWLSKAGKLGAARAYTWMGLAYTQEYVEAYDYIEAIVWFREAAQRGDDYARVFLADLYVAGRGASKNPAAARPLYELAAQSSDPNIAERARKGLLRVQANQPGLELGDWAFIAAAAFFTYALLAPDNGSSSVRSPRRDVEVDRRDRALERECIVRGGIWAMSYCHMPPPPCRTSDGRRC
jgi:TPR repeat protein